MILSCLITRSMLVGLDDQSIKKYTSMVYGNCRRFYYHRLMFMRVAD